MTRKLLLLLPLVSLLPFVTGCAKERPAPDSVVLMLPAAGQELQVWQDAINAFTEASQIKVTVQSPTEGDYYAKFQKMAAAGSAPDLVAVDATRFPELVAAGSFEPINQFLQSQEDLRLSDFYPWAIHSFQSQGSTYGLPVNVRVQALACDMDSFELAMKPRPTADWNWKQFADLAKAMTRERENGTTVYGAALGPWWQIFVWQNGGELVDNPAAPTRSTLNTPQAIEALQFLADLTNKDKVAAPFATTETGPADTIAARGAALAMVNRGQVPRLDKVQEGRFELMPLPKGKVAANLGLTTGLCLVKGSKRQAEALKLLAYLGGLDGQKQLVNAGVVVPALESLAGSEYFAGGDPNYPFRNALKVARQLPTTPRYREIETVWAEELAPLWAGKTTAAEACARIDERVNGILKAGSGGA